MKTWANEPEAIQALYRAYVQVSGFKLAWSHQRANDLRVLAAKEVEPRIGPEDVLKVLRFIKREMGKPKSKFGPTSLMWRWAMDPDTMEERILLVRQWEGRRPKPSPIVSQPRHVSTADTVNILAPDTTEREPKRAGHVASGVLGKFKEQLAGKSPDEVAALHSARPIENPAIENRK